MGYTQEDTVIIFSSDKAWIHASKKIALELKLKLFIAKVISDIYAIPSFFAVIDAKHFDSELCEALCDLLQGETPKEFGILLIGQVNTKIPAALKKFISISEPGDTTNRLKLLILNKRNALLRRKKNNRGYDKTIFRLMYILRSFMRKNSIIKIDELCREFNVSDKTIKRDILLLRSLGEDIIYIKGKEKDKCGYKLNFSMNQILIDDIYENSGNRNSSGRT